MDPGKRSDKVFIAWDTTTKGLRPTLEALMVRDDGRTAFLVPGIISRGGEILRDVVVDGILRASRVLVMVDLPNANVGFEAGLALGLGKPIALAHYSAHKPEWLGESLFRNYLTHKVEDVSELEQTVVQDELWFRMEPPASRADANSPKTLSLCPLRYEGSACRTALEQKDWIDPCAGGSGEGLNLRDLPRLTADIDRLVWTIAQYGEDADERDGCDNTNNGIIAGWFFARQIEQAKSDPDAGLNWEGLRERLLVYRSVGARRVADVEPLEQTFFSFADYQTLLGSAFLPRRRFQTPLHWVLGGPGSRDLPRRSLTQMLAAIPVPVRVAVVLVAALAIVAGAWFRLDRRYRQAVAQLDVQRLPGQSAADLVRHHRTAAGAASRLRRCDEFTGASRAAFKALYEKSKFDSVGALIEDLRTGACSSHLSGDYRCYLGILGGNLFKLAGKVEDADERFRLLESNPDCSEPSRQIDIKVKLGQRRLELGKYRDALTSFHAAAGMRGEGNPAAEASLGLAKTSLALGRFDEARAALDTAADQFKSDRMGAGHVLKARADAELRQGRLGCAQVCLRESLEAYGDAPTVQRGNAISKLAEVQQLLGDTQAAAGNYERARTSLQNLDPDEQVRIKLAERSGGLKARMRAVDAVVSSNQSRLAETIALGLLERARMKILTGLVADSEGSVCLSTRTDLGQAVFGDLGEPPDTARLEDPVIAGDRATILADLQVSWKCEGPRSAKQLLLDAVRFYGNSNCHRKAGGHVRLGELAMRSVPANVSEAEQSLAAALSACDPSTSTAAAHVDVDWRALCPTRSRSVRPGSTARCSCDSEAVASIVYPAELAGRIDLLAAKIRRLRGDAEGARRCYHSAEEAMARAQGIVGAAIVALEQPSARVADAKRATACATLASQGAGGWYSYYDCAQATAVIKSK